MGIEALKNSKKILIRGTNWIGDAVMTLPALASIRKTFPSAEIQVLAKPWVAEVYKLSPDVDKIFMFKEPGEHQGIAGKMKLASELKKQRFDLAIYLQNAIEAAIIGWLARIPLRAGYDSDCRGFLLTHSVPRTKQIRSVYQVDYYLNMVKSLGCKTVSREASLSAAKISGKAERYLIERGLSGNPVLIGLAPGAMYGPAKRWFPDRFGAVAKKLAGVFDSRIIIFGSKGDVEVEIGRAHV
jgi:heptosyltransferase II